MTTEYQAVNNTGINDTTDREITITRLLNAPRELVFEVWTDPKHVAKWWGPDGFTTTVHSMDVKLQGVWRLTMHGHGRDFENKIIFTEVVKPERLVFKHVVEKDTEPVGHQTIVTFEDRGSKTFLTMRLLFETPAAKDFVVKEYGAIEGGNQTIGKLAAYLTDVANEKDVIITREFNAPRELVYKAWTEPERLAQWWGPKGMDIKVYNFDLRPGGKFHYSMVSPDGKEMFGLFVYREIVAPESISFVNSFADEHANIIRAPFFPVWPLEVWNVLTLKEHDGKTTLVLRGRPINATEEENNAFHAMRPNMDQGFAGTFEKLDEYLAKTNN